MQQIISKLFTKLTGWLVCFSALVLSAFGIYLGRYLRWNSWDIVSNPSGLFRDIMQRVMNPFLHPRTCGITLFYSAFLILAYFTLQQIVKSYWIESTKKMGNM